MPTSKVTGPGTSSPGVRRPRVRLAPGRSEVRRVLWIALAALSFGFVSPASANAGGRPNAAAPADDRPADASARGTGERPASDADLRRRLAPPPAYERSDRVDPPPKTRKGRRRARRQARWEAKLAAASAKRAAKRAAARAEDATGATADPNPTPSAPTRETADGEPVWTNRWSSAFVPLAASEAAVTAVPSQGVSFGGIESCLAPPPADPTDPGANQPAADEERRPEAPTLLRKAGVPPFWIEREYDTHTSKAIAFPPLFLHRTPKPDHPERFVHLNPFAYGWYSKQTQRRRWFSPALFFGSFSERKTVWGAVPLLMGYRRVGEQFNFGQFPLVWYWGTKFVKNVLVVPFHYQQRAPDGFRGVSALLFWYGNRNLQDADLGNDRRHFVAAPVFWRFSRGLRTLDISPLYVGGENKLTGLKHRALAPFFLWQSREFGNRKELWTLPFIRRSDSARRVKAWAVPPGLVFSHQGPDRSLLSATPLFWRGENRLRGSRFTMAGLFGRYTDPRQSSTFVAPVWFRFADKQAKATTDLILPLGFARRTPERRMVWTLLGGGGKTAKGWAAFALPVLGAAGRTDAGTKYQGALGVLWHVDAAAKDDKPRRNTFVLGPLAYAQRRGPRGAVTQTRVGLPPLLTFGAFGGDKRYQVVTPLFWHVRQDTPELRRRTIVAGGFFHHQTDDGTGRQTDGGLPPLFFYGSGSKRRYAVVPWLLTADVSNVAERRRLTLSPIYVRSSSPTHRTQGFAGIAWDVQRAGERHSVAFPLYYRRQIGDRSLTLTPIGGRYRNGPALTSVFGLYARRKTEDRDGAGFLPIVWWDKRQTAEGTSRHLVIAPALIRRRTPGDDLDMISPLVWRRVIRGEGARRNLAVVPFYFRQRQRDGVDVDAGVGFFYARNPRRRTHTLIAGPAFHRLSREGIHAGVAPLYWWHDSVKKRRLIALPTIIHIEDKDKDSHTTIAVPLWFDRKQANGRRGWAAFPFLFGGRRLHNFTRFSVAPPGYFDIFRLGKNARFTGHVPLLFRYQKGGFLAGDEPGSQYTLWGSAPFFLVGKDGKGRRTHAVLAYYYDRSPEGWRLWTPLFGITNRPGKLLSWYGGPVGVRTSQTHRRVMALPLYYRKKHRLQDSSLTLAAPPLFISRRREDRRFFEAGLLFWQFRELHRVSTAVVPPVFFHSYAYKQRRLYWTLPLFYRDNNMGEDKTLTAIAPALYTQRRNGENLDFVQFPLVWHIERGTNQGTFGAFVWWDIRVKDKILQLVPAAYTRWANADKDTRVIGPFLGWWTKGKGVTEGDLHWRALFGIFGGGREGGRKYRAIFGRKIDAGPATAVDTKAGGQGNDEAGGKASVGGAATPGKPASQRKMRRIGRRASRRAN